MNKKIFDFLIIGSGLAGLYSAIHASRVGTVALATKSTITTSNTFWAQGGIAAAVGADDSTELHYEDTIKAGCGLCNKGAVKVLVNDGILCVEDLISLGMPFDKERGEIHLGLEGAHSRRRILHAGGDATGSEVIKFLAELVTKNNNVKIFENTLITSLLVESSTCYGASLYGLKTHNHSWITAATTILATGGASAIYSNTTNPRSLTGDGVSLAYKAGAEISNMEFIQFHPSALYKNAGEPLLISEAVRGEGAHLVNHKNHRFMKSVHKLAELAPRNIVAHAMFNEMVDSKVNHLYLKLDHLDSKIIKSRFSNIYRELKKQNIDMSRDPIPVAPAAHYMIGGIKTDLNGATNIKRLFAIGECASTGVHGANRLASNSLLECLVFGKRAVNFAESLPRQTPYFNPVKLTNFTINKARQSRFLEFKNRLAVLISKNVGIVKTADSLNRALNYINNFRSEVSQNENEFYDFQISNLIELSTLIASSAFLRKESRGSHIRGDYNQINPDFMVQIVLHVDQAPKYLPI